MSTRRARAMAVVATCFCAVAIAAVPASAHQFTASALKSAFPLKTKGVGVGTQSFKFGKIEIECESETTKGTVTESPTQVLKVEASYKECVVPITVWGQHTTTTTHFKVEYLYHANGLVQTGSELVPGPTPEVEIGAGSATMGISNTGGCKVVWPAQTIPSTFAKQPMEQYSAAVFSPEETAATNLKLFPTGFQKKLVITNEFKSMDYSIFEKGLCSELEKTEGNNGHYSGKLILEAASGNLAWE
jgi:hypothetical protein